MRDFGGEVHLFVHVSKKTWHRDAAAAAASGHVAKFQQIYPHGVLSRPRGSHEYYTPRV
jgi:hypothetical protein